MLRDVTIISLLRLCNLLQDVANTNGTIQQDGAPTHISRNTTDYLKKEKINFIEPDMWPPNSPDLNPDDYAVWGSFSKESTTHENLIQY